MPRTLCALTVVVLAVLTTAALQSGEKPSVAVPDTPAGTRLSALVSAFNSGDETKWRAFIEQEWKPSDKEGAFERRLEMFQMLHGDLGGINIWRLEETSKYSVSVTAKAILSSAPFEWVAVTVNVDSLPPHQVVSVSIQPTQDPQFDPPPGPMTDEKLAAYLDDYLGRLSASDRFSGAVLVAKDGRTIFARAYGEACKNYGAPNSLDTKFNLGSMNKMFTGVAIMQLVEQGKISLHEPVGTYLPDLPRKDIAEKVTIHHLLTHTSGMQDYWQELFDSHWWEVKTVRQYADLIFADSLLFEPGAEFHYSNSGPIVLGLVIEKVTGQSYYDYVREHIYQPAGMINTDCFEVDRPVPNLAIGYTKMGYDGERDPNGEWYNNLFMHAVKGGPAGGGYSTVEDLLRFDVALRQNKLISKESFDTLTTGKADMGPGDKYAYLFGDRTVNGQRIIGHSGGAPGINAVLDMYLNSGYTVAVMANYDEAAGMVASQIQRALTQ